MDKDEFKPITVAELIKELQTLEPNRIVVMSGDAEGNSFSPLHEISPCAYQQINPLMGEIGLEKLTKEAKAKGYTKQDVIDGVPAVCFWRL